MNGLPAQRGFTLIELVVAMAVFGLLAVLLGSGLRFGVAALERVRGASAAAVEGAAQQSLIRSLLERAQPLGDREGGTVAFAGAETELAFVAVADGRFGDGALYRFVLTTADGRAVLDRCLADGLGLDAAVACVGATERMVLDAVPPSLRIAYFGARTPQEAPAWRPTWNDAVALPSLIRISLGAGDLVVAPRIDPRRVPVS